MRARLWVTLLACAGAAGVGCATYRKGLGDFEKDLRNREPAKAAEVVKAKAFADGDSQVVYLLEYGTAQQIAGNYGESTRALLLAEGQTEVKDYHSISRVAGSLLLSEGVKQYKGDDFEKVMINGMLAVNYLAQNKIEDAQVECRKLNDKLYKYRFEAKRDYRQSPFAFYLSALIWESAHDWDAAYIDFKNTYDVHPNFPYLREDLVRAARAAHRDDDLARWTKAFAPVTASDLRKNGEAVLIFQQGFGPIKRPHPNFSSIPKLYPVDAVTVRARFEVEKGDAELTQTLFDVTDTAVRTLDEQYAGLVAMRLAGIGTKAVVADQIRQQNALLGNLAWIGMNLLDHADLRQWSSLPATVQIAKLRLKPGAYKVRAVGLDGGGRPSGETSPWFDVRVAASRKTFVNWRSLK